MKWLDEETIARVVEEMRIRQFENRAGFADIVIEVDKDLSVRVNGDRITVRDPLLLIGCARPIDTPAGLLLVFNRAPTDDELRAIQERLQ